MREAVAGVVMVRQEIGERRLAVNCREQEVLAQPAKVPAGAVKPPGRRPGTVGAMNDTTHDVIVIGSGMGGLTTAALLARLHRRRVLVLERHYRAGGFTHTFSRPGGFSWDVGVHYVGEVNVPGTMRDAAQVATGGQLAWAPMPEGFDVLRFLNGLLERFEPAARQHHRIARFQKPQRGALANAASRASYQRDAACSLIIHAIFSAMCAKIFGHAAAQ
mgnify:CR=1 FL=1